MPCRRADASLAFFALTTTLALGGCDSGDASPGVGGANTSNAAGGTGAGSGGAGGAISLGSSEPFADGMFVCDAPPPGTLQAECCPMTALTPPAIAQAVLDLSDPAAIGVGTCSTYFTGDPPARQAQLLPQFPDAYPLKVILPAVTTPDPACLETCPEEASPARTTFGIAFATGTQEAGYLIGGGTGRVLAISVPPPWYFVSGGCGEACPWPCVEGYQEFGVRSCITLTYGDFGFATTDPSAPSVEAVIALIEPEVSAFEFAPNGCCVFGG